MLGDVLGGGGVLGGVLEVDAALHGALAGAGQHGRDGDGGAEDDGHVAVGHPELGSSGSCPLKGGPARWRLLASWILCLARVMGSRQRTVNLANRL